MFNKKEWVIKNLKSGFDSHQFTAEYVMTISMEYSMAGVLDDADLEELALYTAPIVEISEEASAEETQIDVENVAVDDEQSDTETTESE